MSLYGDVLAEFGRSLGIDGMAWPQSGLVQLEFEQRGTLYLEDTGDAMLVYLVRQIDPRGDSAGLLRRALQACHYREGLPYAVQPGLRGDSNLVFLVRLEGADVTLPTLERALGLLTDMHMRVQD